MNLKIKIIDRNDPINLIGGIYTKNNPKNGNEMIVEVVGILKHHMELHKYSIANYFILDILTSKTGLYLNSLHSYISGPYNKNKLLHFTGSINNKYAFELCDKFLHDYTKKNDLNK